MEDRRGFLRKLAIGMGGLAAAATSNKWIPWRSGSSSLFSGAAQAAEADSLVWVEGSDPYQNAVKAVAALGGMQRFVNKGQRVAILPNIGWARTPAQAANTNPAVVKAIIDMCEEQGAKSITVFCNPCNDMRVCLELSGIGKVIEESSARFEFINNEGWRKRASVKGCTHLKDAEVYRLVDDSDVMINCPVAKHHGGAQLTMCCKNLMGAVKDRRVMHQKLHEGIADLTQMVPHQLCVLDATRILLRNGPSGGNEKDTIVKNTVIAGLNPAHVDVMGTSLFNTAATDIGYLKLLGLRGYAETDIAKLNCKRVSA